jgi:two-component system nitrate/nitrite response regulator NarL
MQALSEVASRKSLEECLTSRQEGADASATAIVFILSDVRLCREGLAWSLSRRTEINVLGAAEPSAIVPSQLTAGNVSVLLLDATMSVGLDIVKELKRVAPWIKIVAFAVNEHEDELLAYAEAGIAGYVTRDASIDDVVDAIRRSLQDEIACSPRVAALLFRRVAALSEANPAVDALPPLTSREREVAELVIEGLSNKEISRALRISSATVKNHIHKILEKLQVRRRGEAAARLRDHKRPSTNWRKPSLANGAKPDARRDR